MAHVVFCQRVVYAYFGVMSISAYLKRHGHSTSLVMTQRPEEAAKKILALDPDIVGFSTLTATGEFEWGLQVAQVVKKHKPSALVVFGGIHPTLFPGESLSHDAVDMVCVGEGERALLEVCRRRDQGQDFGDIPNLWVKTKEGIKRNAPGALIEDLDELPLPDRGLYQSSGYFKEIRGMDVMAGRHCQFACSYCYNPVLQDLYKGRGTFFRKHSVDYVLRECKELVAQYRPRSFTFVDEFFSADKNWLSDFSARYRKEIKVPFICNVRADTVDEEIADLLSEAGAATVCLGLETGNQELRKSVLKKPFGNDRLIETARILHSRGIKFLTANMFGLPGETVENAFETVDLNRRIKTDFFYSSVFQPYPGLEITRRARQLGLIGLLKSSDYHSSYFRSSLLRQKDIREVVNLHKVFVLAVKLPFLRPVFRAMIKWPPNVVFDIIFMLSFGWMQRACFKRSLRQLLIMAVGNMKVVYGRKPAMS